MPFAADVNRKRRPEFDRAREANRFAEDVIGPALDLPKQSPINGAHDFRRDKRPPVFLSQVPARVSEELPRPIAFELHQLDERIAHPALDE